MKPKHKANHSPDHSKNMGQLWKRVRLNAGLTQMEVAKALGYLNGQFISNVESGRCRFPEKQLPKIKSLYRLSAEALIGLVLKEEEQRLRSALLGN